MTDMTPDGWTIAHDQVGIRCSCGAWFEAEGLDAGNRALAAWQDHRETCTAPPWSGRLGREHDD